MSEDFDFEAAEAEFTEPSDLDGYGEPTVDELSVLYLAHADDAETQDLSGADAAAYAVKQSVPLALASLKEIGIEPTVENLAMLFSAMAATLGHALGGEAAAFLSALAKGLVLKVIEGDVD